MSSTASYIAFIEPPARESEFWGAMVPQVPVTASGGETREEAIANIKEALEMSLEGYCFDLGGRFPEVQPLEDFPEVLETYADDQGQPCEQVVIEVDMDEIVENVRNDAAEIIQYFVRAKLGLPLSSAAHGSSNAGAVIDDYNETLNDGTVVCDDTSVTGAKRDSEEGLESPK